jgi:probable DNA repair protein
VYAELIERLAAGATVVTPTRRLAAAVRRACDAAQRDRGNAAWASADVLPWAAWLQRAWQAAQFASGEPLPLLLSAEQELALWEAVIADSPQAGGLIHPAAAAQTASEAWHLMCRHGGAQPLAPEALGRDGRVLLGWCASFVERCTGAALLDAARAEAQLTELVHSARVPLPNHLAFYGFDVPDPQRAALLHAFRMRGVRVETLECERPLTEATAVSEPSPEHEIRMAARWARAALASMPTARIGVVVPELTRWRAAIARAFDEVLVPHAALTPWAAHARPWNVSLGLPLAQWPIVHAGLLVLELASGRLSVDDAGVLLRSPFLGHAQSEWAARALLDARLRRLGEPHVTIPGLLDLAAEERELHGCPLLHEGLRRLRWRREQWGEQPRPPSAWGPLLQSLLAALGWPGERTLDSEEFQAAEAWKVLLVGLGHLDSVCAPLGLEAAVRLVCALAARRVFQAQTPDVPVQILGVLESAGLEFDRLMVIGLHAQAWPRPARPNPLLPAQWQKRVAAPGGSSEWELAFARRQTEAWRRAAPHVVFSYPASENDTELAASSLLSGLRTVSESDLVGVPPPSYRTLIHAARSLEQIEDWQTAMLPVGVQLTGGARLLQDQAACAFRAFALHRLGATSLEPVSEGLSPRERGSLLHAALALLWSELRSGERLAALDRAELDRCVEAAVAGAMQRWRHRRASVFRREFLRLEQARLCALLVEWLRVERERAPFEVLDALERAEVVALGGLRLTVRLDRVDRLADGGEVLIDYKTGAAAPYDWFGERPDDPQLPLYTLTRAATPTALAFGLVRRGNCSLTGLGAHGGVAPGIRRFEPGAAGTASDWPAQLAEWRATLERLAGEFRSGRVPVDPKRYPQTCTHCDLRPLCRVEELLGRNAGALEQGE